MTKLMSVSLTEPQVVTRQKTVTRRLNWWENKAGKRLLLPGDRLTLCRKVMGRRKGEPLVRIVDVEVVSVTREPLYKITPEEVAAEGFPDWTPLMFITFFCRSHPPCLPDWDVTRIEWRYIDGAAEAAGNETQS